MFLLWSLLELIDKVQKAVSWQDIGVCFCTTLCIDGTCNVAQLPKDVETIKHYNPLALEECASQSGVPDHVGCIEARVGITRSAIKREVGGEVELPWQMDDSIRSYTILPGVNVLERCAVARVTVPGNIRRESEGMFAKRKIQFR